MLQGYGKIVDEVFLLVGIFMCGCMQYGVRWKRLRKCYVCLFCGRDACF